MKFELDNKWLLKTNIILVETNLGFPYVIVQFFFIMIQNNIFFKEEALKTFNLHKGKWQGFRGNSYLVHTHINSIYTHKKNGTLLENLLHKSCTHQ